MSMLYTFFDDSCKYQHFLSYPQKWQFQIRHPYKGAESTGCLVLRGHLQVNQHNYQVQQYIYIYTYLANGFAWFKEHIIKTFYLCNIFCILKIHISYGFEKLDKAISPPTPPIAASEQFDPAQQKKPLNCPTYTV